MKVSPTIALFAILVTAISFSYIAGCAYFQPAYDKVGSAVKEYCKQPLETRRQLRVEVNKSAAPNNIVVTCAGDPS